MKLSTYKFKKHTFNRAWGDIDQWMITLSCPGKESDTLISVTTPGLIRDGKLYILPTIDYENLMPAGDARKSYKHWRLSLSFLKWRATLLDWQWGTHVEEESETI